MKRNVVISVIDQGAISAFNFALNIALLKWWEPAAFGVFSIVIALGFAIGSFQNALINTPYSVLIPRSQYPQRLRSTLSASNLLFLLACLVAIHIGQLVPSLQQQYFSPNAITAYLVVRLLREYLRARWASELKLIPVLIADVIFIVGFTGVATAVAAKNQWQSLDFATVLWLLTITQLVSVAYLLLKELPIVAHIRWGSLAKQYAPVWAQSRWSLVGVSTTELQNRGYLILAGLLFGSATVGLIQAGRVFFGPLNIVTAAWTRVAKPTMARLFADKQHQRFYRILASGLIGFILFNLLFSGLLWLFWPILKPMVYDESYVGIGIITAQWAIATLLFHLRSTASVSLQAQNRFKPVAITTLWGALFSTISLIALGLLSLANWVTASVIVGEGIALILLLSKILPTATKWGFGRSQSNA